jgi:hypothetical protein
VAAWNSLDAALYTNKASVDSPNFTGVPTAPKADLNTNTTQIATTSFVHDEINAAQLALGTNYAVADLDARDVLTNLVVGDMVFVIDSDEEDNWAQYKVVAIDDGLGSTTTFEEIMSQTIYTNISTKEAVKTTYESNADTNAFTDAEKTKLENVELANVVYNAVASDFTLAVADIGKVFFLSTQDPTITVTVPNNDSVAFPIGTQIAFLSGGDGASIVFDPASGVSLFSNENARTLASEWSGATLIKTLANA